MKETLYHHCFYCYSYLKPSTEEGLNDDLSSSSKTAAAGSNADCPLCFSLETDS
jgi:hypothetical protein